MSANWLTSVRMIISGVLLLLLAYYKGQDLTGMWKKREDLRDILLFSIFGLLLCQATFLGAIKYSNSGTATVLQSLNVVFMSIITALLTRSWLSKKQILTIVLALFGTFLLTTNGEITSLSLSPLALGLGLLSAVGLVIYTLLSHGIISRWGSLPITGWGMLIGGILYAIPSRIWELPPILDWFSVFMIFIIISIGTVLSFSVFLEGVKYIGPVKATLIGCSEPCSAAILAFLFLGTRLSLLESVGFALIILAVVLTVSNFSLRRKWHRTN